ncbi:MAG: hypothetical protein JSV88_31790 [Candidatus Aminicenantes bacterium]|nr:MAG: hypothetical protein JSV88_31790 [Candidatus Aminicenantes bacterium]
MIFKSLFKRVFVAFVITTAATGLLLTSADNNSKPRVKKGAKVTVVSGSLVQWQNVKKISLDQLKSPRKLRPVMNFENPKKIVKPATTNDPVLQDTFMKKDKSLERQALAITPIRDFTGMNFLDNGSGWPPDTCGDVGPTYYVQAVNTSIGIFDKTTGELVSVTTYDALFPSSVGEPCDNNNNGDVIILYDKYKQRWFLLDFAWDPSQTGGSYFSIGASKTSDPAGEWWTYCLQADNTLMDDYPKCGVWHDGIYITANMFEFNGNFQHAKTWALKTPELYNGTLISQSVIDENYYAWCLLPGNAKGPNAPPLDAPLYLYAMDADEYGSPSSDALYVWKYSVDWDNSNNTTWTGPIFISGVASFGLTTKQVPQPGTANTLDSLYGRLMYPANYINFGTHESVYLCHLVETNDKRAMRWYEIRISNGNSSLYQQGTYSPDSHHRWMGSICGDNNGNIAMGYSISSSDMYPSICYCGRLSTDAPGVMGQGEVTLAEGSGYQSDYNRWGDYSHLTLDPVDNETLWYTQEYFTAPGTNWQTRIGAFKLGGGPPPPTDDIQEALDTDSLSFTITGDAEWTKVTDVYFYDNDSAKTGTINNNQSCSLQSSIYLSSQKEIKFYWKVSSEPNYDYLTFYVDGVLQYRISGDINWQQKSYTLPAGTHDLRWTYAKDYNVSSGSDCGWLDKVELVTPSPGGGTLAKAVDYNSLTFNTSGDADWFYQATTYYYDSDAAESPDISNNQSVSMETAISEYQSIKFYWKVSSEFGYDLLQFYIDDVLQDQVSGNVDWQQQVYAVPPGKHTLKWTYAKDYSISSGSDCGWVDKLELGEAPEDPIAKAVGAPELIFTLSGDYEWYVTTSDYVEGGDSVTVPSELAHNEEAVMETSISGYTTIKFYWKVSSETNYDYLRFYIDGILKDQVSGETDWEEKIYSVSSGTHTLKWAYSKDRSFSSGADTGWVDKLWLIE